MKRGWFAAILAAGVVCAGTSHAAPAAAAQPAATKPSARALELSRRYAAALKMDAMMQQVAAQLIPAILDGMMKGNPNLASAMTPEMRQAMIEVMSEMSAERTPLVIEKALEITASTFTEAELEELVRFYESPTGRAVVDRTPQMMAQMGQVMRSVKQPTPEEIVERLCTKVDCTKLNAPVTNPS